MTSTKTQLDTVVKADSDFVRTIQTVWPTADNELEFVKRGLSSVVARGAILRRLTWASNDLKQKVFDELVDLASIGHSDIGLCRTVIKSLPRLWLLRNISASIEKILLESEDEETYRRLAELLYEIDNSLLRSLVEHARKSENIDIREIADDFDEKLNA